MKQRLKSSNLSGFDQVVAIRCSRISSAAVLGGLQNCPPSSPFGTEVFNHGKPLPSDMTQPPPVMESTQQPWVSFPAVVILTVNYTHACNVQEERPPVQRGCLCRPYCCPHPRHALPLAFLPTPWQQGRCWHCWLPVLTRACMSPLPHLDPSPGALHMGCSHGWLDPAEGTAAATCWGSPLQPLAAAPRGWGYWG